MTRRSPTVRVARWSATHPWRAIGVWLVFVATAVAIGASVSPREQSDLDEATGEWGRAERIIERGEFRDQLFENVLITARSGPLDQAAAKRAADDAADRLRALPEVAAVEAPVASPDGTAVLVRAELAGPKEGSVDGVQPLLDATAAVQAAHPALLVEQAGAETLNKSLDETLGDDFVRAELFSIPLTLLILLVAFGALIAAAVPLLLALSAVAAAIGLTSLVSILVPTAEPTNSIILLIGLAVGVDYSLFYVRREREERALGRAHVDAVEVAAATSGHAVVVSGLAVVVSMAGLFLVGDSTFASIGAGAITVVTVAVIGSLTVLPALLGVLGRWIDRPRVPLVWRLTAQRSRPARLWPALLRPVLARPALTLTLSVGALVAIALPALGLNLNMTTAADLPRSIPIMQTYDRLTAAFPSTGTEHVVAVEAPAERRAEVTAALRQLVDRTADDPLFAHDRSPEVRTSADGTVTVAHLGVPYDSGDPRALQSYELLRSSLVPQTVGAVEGAQAAVGGDTSAEVAFTNDVKNALPLVIGFVLLLTFVVLMATFRSVVVALTAIALNALSAAAAFGLLVLVFQYTWAEGLLDFRSNGGIVAWLPLLLFVILFGLSMDYHVFVVSRIREAALAGMPTADAVRHGITTSAGVVTSAAVVMVAVFSVFATLSTLDMKQLGVGLASAILIDATLIRAVVLPSAMTLLGRWNWWAPAWLDRALPVPGEAAPPASEVPGPRAPSRDPEQTPAAPSRDPERTPVTS